MSNYLAIATVTATLSQLIQAAVGTDVPGATVTTVRPDGNGNNTPAVGVNLYLYQVTPNAARRNADLPTRRANGQLVDRPQAALDLHYLLTFYGDEGQLEPQRVLGSVVRTLHAQPVLTRQMIRTTIANAAFSYLANSNLADEVELVKFTPLPLSLEELSKLWSVFFKTPYTLSLAYQGTVVLIEGEETPQVALPVRQRNLYVVPFRQSVIEQVLSEDGANQPIVAGGTMLMRGKELRGDVTRVRVRIGEAEVKPEPQDISTTQIRLPLSPVAALRAGVQGVQVVHRRLMGAPPVEHGGVESNVAAFVLHPTINKNAGGNYQITVTDLQVNADSTRSANVRVNLIKPDIDQKQRVVLLLNELTRPTETYRFDAPPRTVDVDSITFPISGVEAGAYLVRIQVDGAESPLDVDANGQYSDPKMTIP